MEKLNVLILFCIAASIVLKSAYSLKCYKCAGGGCGDPFEAKRAKETDCTGMCLKRIIKEAPADNIANVKTGDVYRDCFSSTTKSHVSKCEDIEQNRVKGTACYCDKDLCNASVIVKSCYATIAVLLANALLRVL